MVDSLFKAIADVNRRKILTLLHKQGTMTVSEIATHFDISLPTLSEHLRILREAKVVTARKYKQYSQYSLNHAVFEELSNWVTEFLPQI